MASDSESEEFYDAAEELSPVKEPRVQDFVIEKEPDVEVTELKEKTDDLKISQDSDEQKENENEKGLEDTAPQVARESENKTELSNKGEELILNESPLPVAPPRKKRQKNAPQRPPPPRLKNAPLVGTEIATNVEPVEESLSQKTDVNQPCITVNSNTSDMNKVLMKGTANEIVKNEDLDECKSPTGSKTRVDKETEGFSTPVRAPSQEQLHDNLVKDVSSSGRLLSDTEILEQVIIKNLDTGETIPLSLAEEKLPQCVNPMALQIMRITAEYTSDTVGQEDGNISDSSLTPNIKLESKRKKLKKFLGKTVQKIKSVADEVKMRREESSSSDEDEHQEIGNIKMESHKAIRDRPNFEKIKLLQELSGDHIGPIWVLKFSICGKLIAAAGQDNVVRVWVLKQAQPYFDEMRAKYARAERGSPTNSTTSVNSVTSVDDDITLEEDSLNKNDNCEGSGPFRNTPFCTYHGHTSDVLDLSWSKNYFLLSSSMDKTVRLWHISRHECLCSFQHVDFVTAICFHPRDDRYFLSGSLDGKIRLWNIPEKKVALWNEIDGSGTSLITAGGFCQHGKLAVVGTYDGRCLFYDTERLKYHTQVTVRSTRGKNARARKISGIEPMPGEDKVLITSNDSRVRLYDLKDHSLFCKYKGVSNLSSQIKAGFSPDGKYIVCGSEDSYVYIWRTYHEVQSGRKDRNEYYGRFSAHDSVVTAAVFDPVPSLIVTKETGFDERGHDDKNKTGHSEDGAGSIETAGQNFHVLASADWSGYVKLFEIR